MEAHHWHVMLGRQEPMPAPVAVGRLEGVTREAIEGMPAGAGWSAGLWVVVAGGEYLAVYEYAFSPGGREVRVANWEVLGAVPGDDLRGVLAAAMGKVARAIERRQVGRYGRGLAAPNRRLFRVVRSEWVSGAPEAVNRADQNAAPDPAHR